MIWQSDNLHALTHSTGTAIRATYYIYHNRIVISIGVIHRAETPVTTDAGGSKK